MLKNIFIGCYMFVVRIIASLCRLVPLQSKMVMLVTFPDSPEQLIKKMEQERFTPETLLFYNPRLNSYPLAKNFIQMRPLKKSSMLSLIFHLSTAKIIVIDNYFPELAAISFRHDHIFQIWHADGALKKFAWEDKSVAHRSASDQKRFKQVYKQFRHVIVGSEPMSEIFKRAFLLSDDQLLRIGVPSTDYYYDDKMLTNARRKWQEKWLLATDKKVLLYAPTFRDGELDSGNILLDIEVMRKQLANDYILLIKLHPAIMLVDKPIKDDDFIKFVPAQVPMRELLALADVLITDYSSSPFEYALLNRPIYFYTPDLAEYAEKRGLIDDFANIVPGDCYRSTADLALAIKANRADLSAIQSFNATWNKYSDSNSAERLVKVLKDSMSEREINR